MPRVKLTATQTSTTSGGGYLIPQGFAAAIERAMKSFGGMWEVSRILKTQKGNATPFPMSNDTNRKGYRIAESTDLTTSAQPVAFTSITFNGYKYVSGLVQVPNELLEDSDLFEEFFVDTLAERLWRITNEELTTGDGSSKPNGLMTAAFYGGSSGDDAALAYDDFVKLKHNIDPAYRNSEKCVWMFHDSVLKAIETLKDTAGQPVFTRLDDGLILGHRFVINQELPAFVAGSSSANDGDKMVFFGDFNSYVIRTVKDMRIVRLPQRYAELDQTAFVVIWRVDGGLLGPGTHPIKFLEMSAS